MNCPICGSPAKKTKGGNGGTIYVAEELGDSTEWYDDIDMYICSKDKKHVFYISKL